MTELLTLDPAYDDLEDHDRGLVYLASDNVFGEDGGAQQLGTVSGSVSAGYTVALTVPVNA